MLLSAIALLLLVGVALVVRAKGAELLPPNPPGYEEKLAVMAQGIGRAEGYYHPSGTTKPQRLHNPGDLTDSTGTIRTFASDEAGMQALIAQLDRIYSGRSAYYNPGMTFLEMAFTWTGNDNTEAWAAVVAATCGVSPQHTLAQYLEA